MKQHGYGRTSRDRLVTCHPRIISVMEQSIKLCPFDITIVCGARGKAAQDEYFRNGFSKVEWPNSKHNNEEEGIPMSLAVDAGPWIDAGIPWNDQRAFSVMAGCVLATANSMDIAMRWGGDWDRDGSTTDQTFMDLGHFELVL